MTPSLRQYQNEDVTKLLTRPCMGCFNEQRTGKTPTAITTMESRKLKRLVIVAPASALYPWADEYVKWSGGRPVIVLTGTAVQRIKKLKGWQDGAIIISYGCLKTTAKGTGMLEDILAYKPDGIIADEAHRFKDPGTSVTTSMFRTTSIPYRLALTGTPAPNKPQEIWSILHWLYPTYYKSYWNFIQENFNVQRMQGSGGHSFMDIKSWIPGRRPIILKEIESISTQRKRKDVMPWLPAKDYIDVRLPCTISQTKYLNELEKYFETGDGSVVVQGVLDRIVRVRQICAAPQLLDLKGGSPKLDWLLEYLNDYPDTPTIVFTKFTSFIHLIMKELQEKKKDYRVIIGETSSQERAENVKAFQSGATNLLLLNIDAGKEALTLDRGECAIFLDQFPPAADIQQAEDRFVATTEDKADKPHKVIRLMMKDTYDEQLYKLVEARASATDVINNYKNYLKGLE